MLARVGLGMRLEQVQKLILTPELRQAIAILQCPVMELATQVEQALIENPALELKEPDTEPEAEQPEPFDADWLNYFCDRSDLGYIPRMTDTGPADIGAPQVEDIGEHVAGQLRLLNLPPDLLGAALHLAEEIDPSGYLPDEALAHAARRSGLPHELFERARCIIQTLEPTGVGAADLRECLTLQWQARPSDSPLVPRIIEFHLDDLAHGRMPRIAAELQVGIREVQKAVDQLRTYNPRPAASIGGASPRFIVPDITVERVGREYVILVNDSPIPRLMISPLYRRLAETGDPATRRYLEGRIQAAVWFVRSIEQRRMTLYRIMDAIVRFQRNFFDHGVRHLRPLTLREVAEEVGVHESTVSRAAAHKYVQTPHGAFELKYFFSSGVEDATRDGVAAESVKHLLRDLIGGEDARDPLSDQQLADLLRRQGIVISRRTVAKYREAEGIPSSQQRRRY